MNKDTKAEKFIFETDFFEVAVNERTPAEIEQGLEQAKSSGYSEGLVKGQQQALEQFATELESYLTPLKAKLEQFATEKSEIHNEKTSLFSSKFKESFLFCLFCSENGIFRISS